MTVSGWVEFKDKFVVLAAFNVNGKWEKTGYWKKVPKYIVAKNNRLPADEWRALRAKVFERDDYTCAYCGARGVSLQCDHIVPVSRGGDHRPNNLATACRRCNQRKRDKLLSEWQR